MSDSRFALELHSHVHCAVTDSLPPSPRRSVLPSLSIRKACAYYVELSGAVLYPLPASRGECMLRSLTTAPLPVSRLGCNIAATSLGDSLPLSCPSSYLTRLLAMSAVEQPAASGNVNKRAANSQQSGKWQTKRIVWKERDRGSRATEHREGSGGTQQTSGETVDDSSGTSTAAVGESSGEKRLPKRKVAVVFGYNGGGYAGLQIQTGSEKRTVEAEVADAILKAGGMLPTNREQLSKLSWQRCARTDKGVHASANVLALNLITQPEGVLEVSATSTPPHSEPPPSHSHPLTVPLSSFVPLVAAVVLSAHQLSPPGRHSLLCVAARHGLVPRQALMYEPCLSLHPASIRIRSSHQPAHRRAAR